MKQPKLANNALINDIHQTTTEKSRFSIWWLGQSGFLVRWNGKHLLFDPYLSDSLTKKYADTDKPHIRMTARVIEPERLDFIDVVTSSHNHTDHLDADTLIPLWHANPNLTIVVPEANREFAAQRLDCDSAWLRGVNDGESIESGGFTIHAVPAAHETLEQDVHGNHKFLGYIAQFGNFTVYHSGDTVRYGGMAERLREFSIDVALLPINGSKPERRVAGNLDGPAAVQLAKDAGIGLVIPCHYDMFEFNTVTPDDFIVAAQAAGQGIAVLENGEAWHSGV